MRASRAHFFFAFLIAAGLCLRTPAEAHKGHHQPPESRDSVAPGENTATIGASEQGGSGQLTSGQAPQQMDSGVMGLEEKLGSQVPLDVKFANQNGDSVVLRECIRGPTLLTLLYFGCSDACGLLLSGVANVLRPSADNPSTAPNFIALSIGEREGPADAAKAQAIAAQIMHKPYPAGRWHFLTGPAENIRKVAAATGFHYVKKGDDYDHPLLLMVLSPEGKVSRYITGTDFLPADITLSLMEANKGTIQPTIARIIRSCFSFDPHGRRLVFKTLQVSATVILTLLAGFIAFLLYKSKAGRKRGAA